MSNTKEKYLGHAWGTPAKGDRVSVQIDSVESQRPLDEKKCWDYINKHKGVDWNLFGYVKVARLPNGSLKLLDGQHKTYIVRNILPHVTEVPADIIDCTPIEAAKYFDELNGGSNKSINQEDRFWAKICMGDDFALVLLDVLKKTTFHISKANLTEYSRPIKYTAFKKSISCGEKQFLRAAEIIQEVFPNDKNYDLLIEGLSRLFAIQDYYDLMDGSKGIGKNFVDWLKLLRNELGQTPGKFKFKKYYNAGPFGLSVAYGLARHFFASERSRNRKTPKLASIENIWNKYFVSPELESLEIFG